MRSNYGLFQSRDHLKLTICRLVIIHIFSHLCWVVSFWSQSTIEVLKAALAGTKDKAYQRISGTLKRGRQRQPRFTGRINGVSSLGSPLLSGGVNNNPFFEHLGVQLNPDLFVKLL